MAEARHMLIIRFSAMGDVAMSAAVIRDFRTAHPDVKITVTSRTLFQPFFSAIPNVAFHPFAPKKEHKGFFGLFKLFMELRKQRITHVADLHNNLRSSLIRILFFLTGCKIQKLDKGRAEKKKLTRKFNKELKPLKQTVQRYADVFNALGFPFTLQQDTKQLTSSLESPWIGVSPFAQHLQKVYPLYKMEAVVLKLATAGYQLFIFGGTDAEAVVAADWESKHPNIKSVIKKMNLAEELELISKLSLMISMDSSGMHMAALKDIPVVSIWGATHPFTGFLGYGQQMDDAVQIDLYCRPCSVYGNVPCYRGDFACMNNLPEQQILDKVFQKLNHG
ncbi:glycosyltransferase family 9 protein [Pedobacter duraquae]|uniref:ADP-heptose:LPS heptosyltransferase n=1 Tax=Pedobacter duraquae TaxID=425511 RepID=A0A4R6IKZ1_9SPHI|nr:glycosyltransferase family 9 protein [Pedobacter duraquae]TDO22752.1 ADP-heptose:LPS heptosyltransferase [Pedobacter duraquae]